MTPMTSALALARHRLVNERRDGPRWAEALREGAAMRERAAVSDVHVRDVQVTQTRRGRLETAVTLPDPDGTTDHELTGTCWCQPIVEHRPPEDRRFVHRASLDVPHVRTDGPDL